VKEFGFQGSVREVGPGQDPRDAIAFLVRHTYDVIVVTTIFPGFEKYISPVAAAFPGARLLVPDVRVPEQVANVHSFVFRIEEVSYLAGYLGALMEKRGPGKHVVSSVGGEPEPQVDPFIAGYQAGAKKADPHITTLNGYSHDFVAPRKCRAVALGQIARGSGVVFDVASGCGRGALQTAKEKGVWGIGVDVDQSYLGPHVLTSVLKRAGRGLYPELRAFNAGRLPRSGTTSFGLRENAVGLGRFSPLVPKAIIRKVDRIRQQIVAGTIRVPARFSS